MSTEVPVRILCEGHVAPAQPCHPIYAPPVRSAIPFNHDFHHDPPMQRPLHEPASTGVADLRREYGMVFKVTMPVKNYFTVRK